MKKESIPAFLSILETIDQISDYQYQIYQWVNRKDTKSYACYENATMYFLEDGEAVLESWDEGRIDMTDKQYKMFKKLYEMVDAYDMSDDRPETDREIVEDPKWHEIRDYAKLVYKELMLS